MWYTIEYYSAVRKEDILLSAMWMDLEYVILGEISRTEKQVLYDIIYMKKSKKVKA